MTKIRLILLATTAISATALTQSPASADPMPIIVAQAAQPDQKQAPKAPPKAAPPKAAPPTAAPPPAAPKAPPPAARPAPPAPPKAAPPAPPKAPPPAPPKAAPPSPPKAPPAPPRAAPTPPAAPKAAPPPAAPRVAPESPRATPTPPAAAPKEAPSPATAPKAAPAPAPVQTPASKGAPAGAAPSAPPVPPGVRDVTPSRPAPNDAPARSGATPPVPGAAPTPRTPPPGAAPAPGTPATPGASPRTERRGPPPGLPAGTPAAPASAPVAAPLPPAPAVTAKPIPAGSPRPAAANIDQIRRERKQTTEGGRTVIREPGRVIIKDPNGQSFIRHSDVDRFRYGARDVRVQRQGNDTRTVIVRPDGSQIITLNDNNGRLLRRTRRDRNGHELIIIDNRHRGPSGAGIAAGVAAGVVAGAIGGYFVSLPPPVLHIPHDRYIVEAEGAPPELIYDTLIAPPVERIDRAYSLEEIRYSPSVRQRMRSIDLDTITFETGSAEIDPNQAAKLQVIADGINRAIEHDPRTVFLIEGHTDAVGNDVDNLSLSDRRAESAAALLTQQFNVPPENLTSQGYGEQYLKVATDGAERQNRRVTVRNITPLLNGGEANAAPR